MKFARALWTILAAVFTGACLSAPDLPYPCAEDGTCPAGEFCANGMGCFAEGSCTPGDDSCGDGERCALAKSGSGTYATACVAASATSADKDAACSQSLPNIDNCGDDAICDSSFSSDGTSTCRAFCSSASECGTNEECVALDKTYSVCVPTCSSVDACGDSATCRVLDDGNGVCEIDGPANADQGCSETVMCAAGLECNAGVCVPECDAQTKCPAGLTCDGSKTGTVGLCGCDLFSDQCGPNRSCRVGELTTTCSPVGTATNCTTSADCRANEYCEGFSDGTFSCLTLCDNENPCNGAVKCDTSVFATYNAGQSDPLGVCFD